LHAGAEIVVRVFGFVLAGIAAQVLFEDPGV